MWRQNVRGAEDEMGKVGTKTSLRWLLKVLTIDYNVSIAGSLQVNNKYTSRKHVIIDDKFVN